MKGQSELVEEEESNFDVWVFRGEVEDSRRITIIMRVGVGGGE